jgi:TIR domain
MAHDVFISYSNQDKPAADATCAALESAAIRCWIAPRDVPAGVNWPSAVLDGISQSRLMVLIFSSHAIESKDVQREVAHAFRNDVIVIPLRIENVQPSGDMEYFIATTHWLDAMTPPLEAHLQRLCQRVAALLPTLREDRRALLEPKLSKVVSEEPRVAVDVLRPPRSTGKKTSRMFQSPTARKLAYFATAAMAALVLIAILWFIKSPSASPTLNPQSSSSELDNRPPISVGQGVPLPRQSDVPPSSSQSQEAPAPPAGWIVKPFIDPKTGTQTTIGNGLKVFEARDPRDSSRKMFFGSKNERNPKLDMILGKQY